MAISTTAQLIARIESNNNAHAMRYEPAFRIDELTLTKARKYQKVTHATAGIILKTSWGKYQMMGYNIYFLGYQSDIIDFCTNMSHQDKMFQEFLEYHNINYTLEELKTDETKRNHFAKVYNGSLSYADKILEVL